MACCVSYDTAKAQIEEIVKKYYPYDYKFFAPRRTPTGGITYKIELGLVVLPDADKNTQIFEELLKLAEGSGECIAVRDSNINWKDERLVDLFILEITTEVNLGAG